MGGHGKHAFQFPAMPKIHGKRGSVWRKTNSTSFQTVVPLQSKVLQGHKYTIPPPPVSYKFVSANSDEYVSIPLCHRIEIDRRFCLNNSYDIPIPWSHLMVTIALRHVSPHYSYLHKSRLTIDISADGNNNIKNCKGYVCVVSLGALTYDVGSIEPVPVNSKDEPRHLFVCDMKHGYLHLAELCPESKEAAPLYLDFYLTAEVWEGALCGQVAVPFIPSIENLVDSLGYPNWWPVSWRHCKCYNMDARDRKSKNGQWYYATPMSLPERILQFSLKVIMGQGCSKANLRSDIFTKKSLSGRNFIREKHLVLQDFDVREWPRIPEVEEQNRCV